MIKDALFQMAMACSDNVEQVEEGAKVIRIKYFEGLSDMDLVITKLGDWIDLRSAETITLKQGDFTIIPLGVAMELPVGYEAIVAPRSSTFKKWGIIQTNGIGVIDHSFCGDNDEWGMPVYATRDTIVHRGDRICQFRIQKNQPSVILQSVKELGNEDRNGFGSTGVQ